MLTTNHRKETLSISYAHAVAGAAGVNIQHGGIFDYGVDGTFRPIVLRGSRYITSGIPLDFQLKTTKNWKHEDTNVAYSLENKTFNDFVSRDPEGIGFVLILLCLPENETDWIDLSEDRLKLRNCCYYLTFSPGALRANDDSRGKILIPRANLFTVDALKQLLSSERVRKGLAP